MLVRNNTVCPTCGKNGSLLITAPPSANRIREIGIRGVRLCCLTPSIGSVSVDWLYEIFRVSVSRMPGFLYRDDHDNLQCVRIHPVAIHWLPLLGDRDYNLSPREVSKVYNNEIACYFDYNDSDCFVDITGPMRLFARWLEDANGRSMSMVEFREVVL
uniref:Uncharacterized protein n=1 Tax=Leviviridae sp. TaxID=2027243 RepID=A0A514D558_9VIRU|nr:MAG: hypothetical protein H1BulkLitter6286_000002 [Leviviridae sp.]